MEKEATAMHDAYRLYQASFVCKYLNLKVILGVLTITYFAYSDFFVQQNMPAFATRIFPIAWGSFLVIFNLATHKKYPLLKVKLYHIFFASLPFMMVGQALIYFDSVHISSVISGTVLVYFVLTMELNTSMKTMLITMVLPYAIFLIALFTNLELTRDNSRLLFNLIPTIIFAIVINRVQQKRSFETFKVSHLLDVEKNKVELLYEETSQQNQVLNEKATEINNHLHEIEQQRHKIHKSHANLMDSIGYASHIQAAILPDLKYIRKSIPDFFIFNQPRDIVSGDFFWYKHQNDVDYIAAVDCTGHGVPGAFLSIIGGNILNRALFEKSLADPKDIVQFLSEKIHAVFQKKNENTNLRDGMDLTLCAFDKKQNILRVAGVHNPLVLIRDNELQVFKTDRHEIGKPFTAKFTAYTQHEIELKDGDMVYIFSDGYADQFGGGNQQKFMVKRFRDLLFSIHQQPTYMQERLLREHLEKWKGSEIQTDDILVIGIRYRQS